NAVRMSVCCWNSRRSSPRMKITAPITTSEMNTKAPTLISRDAMCRSWAFCAAPTAERLQLHLCPKSGVEQGLHVLLHWGSAVDEVTHASVLGPTEFLHRCRVNDLAGMNHRHPVADG